jgi:FtsH-binding integral membrane protein
MKDSKINIITTILGLIFWGLSLYEYFNGKDLKIIGGLLIIGGVLVYIKSTSSRKWLTDFISKKLEK